MDSKILKHKLEALKNSRETFEKLSKLRNSKSSSKPKKNAENGKIRFIIIEFIQSIYYSNVKLFNLNFKTS